MGALVAFDVSTTVAERTVQNAKILYFMFHVC